MGDTYIFKYHNTKEKCNFILSKPYAMKDDDDGNVDVDKKKCYGVDIESYMCYQMTYYNTKMQFIWSVAFLWG